MELIIMSILMFDFVTYILIDSFMFDDKLFFQVSRWAFLTGFQNNN